MSGFPKQSPFSQPLPASGNPFAEQVNPYAAPQSAGYFGAQASGPLPPFAGLWRQGNLLVMHKLAPLPDICLKSNQPATRRLKRSLAWHHPAVFLALIVNIFVYAVIALITQKKATIHMPLSEEWFAIRRRRILFAWGLALASIALFVAGIVFSGPQGEGASLALSGLAFFLFLGSLIYGLIASRMVWPKRITDEYIWLKGVHPDYLNRLEHWGWNI